MSEVNIEQTLVSRRLQVALPDGTTAAGTTKLKSRSLGNIAEDATAADIHAVATAIASLMKNANGESGAAAVYVTDKNILESVESD